MGTVLNLGKRLETIVNFCSNTRVVADIGCDHGQVTAELILQAKAFKVIACEISPSSLNKAVRLASNLNILPFVSFREGDGFSVISKYDKVNSAVIAGMGGMEIIKILKESKVRVEELVLQPMRNEVELRGYLLQIGFKIVEDTILKENGKFYTVIKARDGRMKITELELYFGVSNFRHYNEDFEEYLRKEKLKLKKIEEAVGELNNDYKLKMKRIDKAMKAVQKLKEGEN